MTARARRPARTTSDADCSCSCADHVKYHLPMTQAFATLSIGALFHEDGYRVAGEWDNMARNLQYAADYLMK